MSIHASCPECGDIEITQSDITIILDRTKRVEAVYRFLCPNNDNRHAFIVKPVHPRIVDALIRIECLVTQYDSTLGNKDITQHRKISSLGPWQPEEVLNLIDIDSPGYQAAIDQELLDNSS